MAKGKGEEVVAGGKGTAKRTVVERRITKTYSPASERLYNRPTSPPTRVKAPEKVPTQGAAIPEPAVSDNKTTVFWIVACAVVGLGIYLVALVGMSGRKTPQELAKGTPAGDPAAATRTAAVPPTRVSPDDVRRAALSATTTTADTSFTVRIIELPAAQRTHLARILKTKELQKLTGSHQAFMVHLRNGNVVGCVGRFGSASEAAASALATKISAFSLNGRQPFKSAMVWKFK